MDPAAARQAHWRARRPDAGPLPLGNGPRGFRRKLPFRLSISWSRANVWAGAGNVAANIAVLGARVEAFGVTGNDEPGRALQKCFRNSGIGDKGIIADAKRVTTVKTRIIARHQQVVRVDHERREPLRSEIQERLPAFAFCRAEETRRAGAFRLRQGAYHGRFRGSRSERGPSIARPRFS